MTNSKPSHSISPSRLSCVGGVKGANDIPEYMKFFFEKDAKWKAEDAKWKAELKAEDAKRMAEDAKWKAEWKAEDASWKAEDAKRMAEDAKWKAELKAEDAKRMAEDAIWKAEWKAEDASWKAEDAKRNAEDTKWKEKMISNEPLWQKAGNTYELSTRTYLSQTRGSSYSRPTQCQNLQQLSELCLPSSFNFDKNVPFSSPDGGDASKQTSFRAHA